jgi:hypothetical protein
MKKNGCIKLLAQQRADDATAGRLGGFWNRRKTEDLALVAISGRKGRLRDGERYEKRRKM